MDYREEQRNYELRQLFPKMQPVRKAPSLFTINGFGLSMYGKRDTHAPTGSYIKTHCVCALFIPILALGAYRVMDAEGGGWYFLGKETLSGFAKGWNMLLLATLLTLTGAGLWEYHHNSPNAVASRLMVKATQAQKQGQYAVATQWLTRIYYGRSSKRAEAVDRLVAIHQNLPNMPMQQAVQVLPKLLEAQERSTIEMRYPRLILRDSFKLVQTLINKQGTNHPALSIKLLRAVESSAPNPQALEQLKYNLLINALQREPNHAEMASELALIYEKRKQWDKCESLLTPLRSKLGTLEGARILGQSYVHKGKFQEAHALLGPYTEERLRRLHRAEQQYNKKFREVQDRAIRDLRVRRGPSSFYTQHFRSLPKVERQRRIGEYLEDRSKKDVALSKHRKALIEAARVVPVAMDLGIVLLYRARTMKDAVARQKELKEAERIFFAIRGIAGKTTRYQLYLGQVYFWMGKSNEGQKLFDQFLQQTRRSYEVLMQLTTIMRELGEHHRAQLLAEEAYRTGKTSKQKYDAAYIRAIAYSTLEEQLLWLKRSDPESPLVQIALHTARGDIARQKGDYREAARFMRLAIESYAQVPKSSVNLNNRALVHFSLFRVTGEAKEYTTGRKLLEEALAFRPSDSIMLGNTALFLFQEAVIATLGKKLDWRYLNQPIDHSLLSFFYQDEAGQQAYTRLLSQHPNYQKALQRYQKMLILAPKSSRTYQTLVQAYWDTKNQKGLEDLLERLRSGKIYFSNPSQYADMPANRKSDQDSLRTTQVILEQQRRLVQQLRSRSKVDFAVAVYTLLTYESSLFSLGGRVDAQKNLQLAAQIYQRHPCSSTRRVYIHALLHLVAERLAQKEPRFARMLQENKRFLSPGTLLAFAVDQDSRIRQSLEQDRDLRQAVELMANTVRAFSDHAYSYEWPLFQLFSPKTAQDIAHRLQNNPLHRWNHQLQLHLSPDSPYRALELYFRARMRDPKASAERIFDRFIALRIPIPSLEKGVLGKLQFSVTGRGTLGTTKSRGSSIIQPIVVPDPLKPKSNAVPQPRRRSTFLDQED